ncbi:MAG: DUF3536 domain-containing protein, partial [Gemmatimonadales bacterium]
LVSFAVDGETFGHHHKFAEMALARAVWRLRADPAVRVENYASVLARMPARTEAELVAPSSWSCPHGIERWRSDCGCRTIPGTSQAWRRPLRAALDWLARMLDARIEGMGAELLRDPAVAREAYGSVAALSTDARRAFAIEHLRTDADLGRALRLLDAVRSRFGMFGSCAWFFDDAAGLETELMLRLAAHALDLAGDEELERRFVERLTPAKSNYAVEGDAGRMYRARIRAVRTGRDP